MDAKIKDSIYEAIEAVQRAVSQIADLSPDEGEDVLKYLDRVSESIDDMDSLVDSVPMAPEKWNALQDSGRAFVRLLRMVPNLGDE